MTNHDERMKAVARFVSGRPDWIDAPAVQAWHRSDGRTEHDGTPGKPRIWSPDYRTTERWSTPSLQNVHWSDLVDVVPLAAPAGSYTRTESPDLLDGGVTAALPEQEVEQRACPDLDAHWRLDEAMNRAERAERERDEWKDSAIKAMADLERAEHPHSLTPDAITDEMVERGEAYMKTRPWTVRGLLRAALTEPPARPEGAEEIEALLTGHYAEPRYVADFLAERGVRVVGEVDPR